MAEMKYKKITKEELDRLLRKHKLWLEDEEGGERLVLIGYDLSGSDLSGSNLYRSNLYRSNLSGSDLSRSDLYRSNLSGSDLSRSNLDYSCLPLWCGSLKAHFDDRQLKQIAYHLVKAGLQSNNASEETKKELAKLIDFANGFHRVDECGRIEWGGENNE